MKKEPVALRGKAVSGDAAMEKVIAAQASLNAIRRELAAVKADRDQLLDEYNDLRFVRPVRKSPSKRTAKVLADRVRVSAGDFHGMMADSQAVAAFLADLKTIAPDEIVLGGDMVECGGWLAKHQPVGFVAQTNYSYQEDVAAANYILDEIQKAAPDAEIHFLEGNHEDRVERWCVDQTMAHKRDADFLRRAFAPQYMLRLEERGIPYYRRSEIYGDGLPRGWIKLGEMFFTHELGGGKNAARDAAVKTAGNVTYFHTHREDSATVVFPGVGMVKAFCPGCLCQMQPVWRHSDPTNWSQGYGVDFIAKSGAFQRFHVPIWKGKTMTSAMVDRFRK